MGDYAQSNGVQPGPPPILRDWLAAPSQPRRRRPSVLEGDEAVVGVVRVTSGRQRRGDGRDNGYLSKLVAKLAMDFYKDRLSEVEAEEMFGPDWSK
jgi:hypothetical protein